MSLKRDACALLDDDGVADEIQPPRKMSSAPDDIFCMCEDMPAEEVEEVAMLVSVPEPAAEMTPALRAHLPPNLSTVDSPKPQPRRLDMRSPVPPHVKHPFMGGLLGGACW
jgi:hypothetical protein